MSTSSFKSASRQQESLLAPLEKKTLIWLAQRMPGWVNSDHLTIEISLATYTIGVLRLSFGVWGPPDLRIVLAIGSFVLLYKPLVTVAGRHYLLCDVSGLIAIIGLIGIAIINSIRNTIRLYRE